MGARASPHARCCSCVAAPVGRRGTAPIDAQRAVFSVFELVCECGSRSQARQWVGDVRDHHRLAPNHTCSPPPSHTWPARPTTSSPCTPLPHVKKQILHGAEQGIAPGHGRMVKNNAKLRGAHATPPQLTRSLALAQEPPALTTRLRSAECVCRTHVASRTVRAGCVLGWSIP
jgi:hypothetical protein